MNHFEKLISKTGTEFTLTKDEREKMRVSLREYMAWKPARAQEPKAVPSPFHTFVLLMGTPARAVTALALILVVGSGSAVFAAEGSAPGDALYPVKLNVTEPLQVALARTPEAKANLQMSFATERIAEAAVLANEGKLSSSTEATLAQNFTENATAASATLATTNTSASDRAISDTSFSTKLAAYENVLAEVDKKHGSQSTLALRAAIRAHLEGGGEVAIADTSAGDTENAPLNARSNAAFAPQAHTSESSGTEASTVRPMALMAPMNATMKIAVAPTPDVGPIKAAATAALQNSAAILASASSSLPDAVTESAGAALNSAASYAAEGDSLHDSDDDEGAYHAYQDSLSASTRVLIYTQAAAALNINPFASSTSATSTTATSTEASSTPTFRPFKGNHPYLKD